MALQKGELRKPAIIALVAAVIVALGAVSYLAGTLERFPGDVAASLWVQSWRAPWLDSTMRGVSALGIEAVAIGLVLLVALALFLKGRRGQAALIVASPAIAYVIRTVVKAAVARPRPPTELVQVIEEADGYSFPSGHVMHYVVFLSLLVFVLSADLRPGFTRLLAQLGVLFGIVLTGFSRIYLGVHWTSDVVGGYAFGAVVVAGSIWAWLRWSDVRGRSTIGHPPPSDPSAPD